MTNSVAARLRLLRHRLGFARRSDMAAHLGLPSSTYSAYEGETGPPKVEWLSELSRRGVNLNWLLTGEGEMLLSSSDQPMASPAVVPLPATGGSIPSPRPHPVAEPEAAVDAYLLAAMISRVEREERDRGRALTALEKGEMIARLYAASARLTESELAGHPLSRAAEGPEK